MSPPLPTAPLKKDCSLSYIRWVLWSCLCFHVPFINPRKIVWLPEPHPSPSECDWAAHRRIDDSHHMSSCSSQTRLEVRPAIPIPPYAKSNDSIVPKYHRPNTREIPAGFAWLPRSILPKKRTCRTSAAWALIVLLLKILSCLSWKPVPVNLEHAFDKTLEIIIIQVITRLERWESGDQSRDEVKIENTTENKLEQFPQNTWYHPSMQRPNSKRRKQK